jgi:hypothetical protein
MPALRMAASLVGRRVAPALDLVADEAVFEEPAASPPAEPAPETRPPMLAPPGMRRFRGRTVE